MKHAGQHAFIQGMLGFPLEMKKVRQLNTPRQMYDCECVQSKKMKPEPSSQALLAVGTALFSLRGRGDRWLHGWDTQRDL